jgi:hypothetical protein
MLVGSLPLTAQDKTTPAPKAAETPTYRAGGTPIAIPPPAGLVEVGFDNRTIMEMFAPESNRLLAAFVLPGDLPNLRTGSSAVLSKYSLVEVPRRGEFVDFGANDFKDMADGASQGVSDVLNSSVKETEEEFNRRMKSLDLDNVKIGLDKPVQLGTFFSKPDAYGLGIAMPVTVNGTTTKMVAGIILLRVKDRAMFAYLYAVYKDQDTLIWLRKTTQDWADAILKANAK